MSRARFADELGLRGFSGIEQGEREPRLSEIVALCDAFKTTPNVLLGGFYRQTRRRSKDGTSP